MFRVGGSAESRQPEAQPVGEIIAVTGSRAQILLDESLFDARAPQKLSPYIGTLLMIDTDQSLVLCLITSMKVPTQSLSKGGDRPRIADVELVGELQREDDGYLRTYRRGVSVYPRLGDRAWTAAGKVLEKAYFVGGSNAVRIGSVHQDRTVPAMMRVDEMLSKHFAIVGSTGSGKSCTVALVLRQILSAHENSHVVLLDAHNEYGECFADCANVMQLDKLNLPFWFLNFDEIVEVLLGDISKDAPEVDILRDLIPVAKKQFGLNRRRSTSSSSPTSEFAREKFSVDAPTPYRISDLLALIDEQMGRLEVKKDLGPYKRVKARIEAISQDPRFTFMFGNLTVADNMTEVIQSLFRIPIGGRPITVVQLMGLPSEVLDAVVSVLARLAFDVALWSHGKVPITFVCEEAHRYVPRQESAGFKPTKRAIARIAKEGRKYGISLGIVSQRPGDIDPTILSQCSTLITMRLSSAPDQAIVQAAVSDATLDLLDFLPTLGTREALVFGEGFTLPSRIVLSKLEKDALPSRKQVDFDTTWDDEYLGNTVAQDIVTRLRTTDVKIVRLAEEGRLERSSA